MVHPRHGGRGRSQLAGRVPKFLRWGTAGGAATGATRSALDDQPARNAPRSGNDCWAGLAAAESPLGPPSQGSFRPMFRSPPRSSAADGEHKTDLQERGGGVRHRPPPKSHPFAGCVPAGGPWQTIRHWIWIWTAWGGGGGPPLEAGCVAGGRRRRQTYPSGRGAPGDFLATAAASQPHCPAFLLENAARRRPIEPSCRCRGGGPTTPARRPIAGGACFVGRQRGRPGAAFCDTPLGCGCTPLGCSPNVWVVDSANPSCGVACIRGNPRGGAGKPTGRLQGPHSGGVGGDAAVWGWRSRFLGQRQLSPRRCRASSVALVRAPAVRAVRCLDITGK